MSDKKGSTLGELEALLFYHGEPVSLEKLGKFLGVSRVEARKLAEEYGEELQRREKGGLTLLRSEDKVQLATKPAYQELFTKLQKEDLGGELTPAALETLSVIAYLGPLTRPEIDYVRGVNSSFMLRSLLLRGLVERRVGGRRGAFQYLVSFVFLKHMGLEKREQLPEYEKYSNILTKVRESETRI